MLPNTFSGIISETPNILWQKLLDTQETA